MTSLIFGSIYMGHQAFVEHRRSKQKQKNYQRWEGLRDEYDEQKKISRQSRSLEIQRTGANYFDSDQDQPILTLRDQQEANDARMSWRPQERWEDSHHEPQFQPQQQQQQLQQPQYTGLQHQAPPQQQLQSQHQHRSVSVSNPSQYWHTRGELRPQKTGATWDEGLPAPLQVTRRSFEDYEYPSARRSSSLRQVNTVSAQDNGSNNNSSNTNLPSYYDKSAPTSRRPSQPNSRSASVAPTPPQFLAATATVQVPFSDIKTPFSSLVEAETVALTPVESHVPGGRMAELIERGY